MKRFTINTSTALALALGPTLALLWLLSNPGTRLPVARAASYTVCPAGPPTCDYDNVLDTVDAAGPGVRPSRRRDPLGSLARQGAGR